MLVGFDDALDEGVADDVFFAEFDFAYAGDVGEHPKSLGQTGLHGAREVDLGGVAGDDHLGVHAQTRQEHLDLMDGGVLGFVEHNDGIVERAAAHEGEWCDLYDVGLHVFLKLDGGDHVLKRIIEGLEIGVDLVFHVAGKEAEFLACLDCGTREDQLADLAVFQGTDGKGNGHVGLACSGRAEGEGKVIFVEGLDEEFLILVAGADRLAVDAVDDHIVVARGLRRLALDDVEDDLFGQFVVLHAILFQLLDLFLELGGLAVVADDLDHRAAGRHAQFREEVADELHVAVVDAVEADGVNIVYDYDSFNHECQFECLPQVEFRRPVADRFPVAEALPV